MYGWNNNYVLNLELEQIKFVLAWIRYKFRECTNSALANTTKQLTIWLIDLVLWRMSNQKIGSQSLQIYTKIYLGRLFKAWF